MESSVYESYLCYSKFDFFLKVKSKQISDCFSALQDIVNILLNKHVAKQNIDQITRKLSKHLTPLTLWVFFCYLDKDTNKSQKTTTTKSILYPISLSSSQALVCSPYQTERNSRHHKRAEAPDLCPPHYCLLAKL